MDLRAWKGKVPVPRERLWCGQGRIAEVDSGCCKAGVTAKD